LKKNYAFAVNLLKKLDQGESMDELAKPIRFALERAQTKELREFWKKAKNYGDVKLCRTYYEISLNDYMAEWENSPAKKYYDFLKQLEINFEN
jgi:hypothetical protein